MPHAPDEAERIAAELLAAYDLTTPEGHRAAMCALGAHPRVLENLTRQLTNPRTPPAVFRDLMKYLDKYGTAPRPTPKQEDV